MHFRIVRYFNKIVIEADLNVKQVFLFIDNDVKRITKHIISNRYPNFSQEALLKLIAAYENHKAQRKGSRVTKTVNEHVENISATLLILKCQLM